MGTEALSTFAAGHKGVLEAAAETRMSALQVGLREMERARESGVVVARSMPGGCEEYGCGNTVTQLSPQRRSRLMIAQQKAAQVPVGGWTMCPQGGFWDSILLSVSPAHHLGWVQFVPPRSLLARAESAGVGCLPSPFPKSVHSLPVLSWTHEGAQGGQ